MLRCTVKKFVPVLALALMGLLTLGSPVTAGSLKVSSKQQSQKQATRQKGVTPRFAPGGQSDPSYRWFLGIFGRSVADGVKVTRVIPGGAFERIGGEVGDIIVSVDGRAIEDLDDLSDALDDFGPVVRLRLIDARTGRLIHRTVDLSR